MNIKGCLLLISKDIFFHSRYYRVYPAISFISSKSFIDIQLFIHSYPAFYPSIFIHILSFILLFFLVYPHLIQPFYPFKSCYLSLSILTFILLVIQSGSRLKWLAVACCLIGPSFACPAQQQSKPLCFYFPAPRCGHCWLPLLAAPALARRRSLSCTGSRCCQRRRRVSAAATASAGAGSGEGGGRGR
jgi:hypothetical protein